MNAPLSPETVQLPPGGSREDKAFQLAYFLHLCLEDEQQRSAVALEIAKKAARRLPVTAKKLGKKGYYKLKGQIYRAPDLQALGAKLVSSLQKMKGRRGADDPVRKGKVRSKINLEDLHRLQCLVFEVSEEVEKEQEKEGSGLRLEQNDMLVRYLAYLVRITMERSSFYVHLGLCRFVYNYGAKEMEELYNFVIQESPNRTKGGEYFRKQKGELLDKMHKRFNAHLRYVVEGGEKFFLPIETPEQFAEDVKLCFLRFQPWDTDCCLPERFNKHDKLPMLFFDGEEDDSEIELKRIHSLLHPDCFDRLVKARNYEKPEKMLRLPDFFPNGNYRAG